MRNAHEAVEKGAFFRQINDAPEFVYKAPKQIFCIQILYIFYHFTSRIRLQYLYENFVSINVRFHSEIV
jgi:hypothetical protein